MLELLERCGYVQTEADGLTGGVVSVYVGVKPAVSDDLGDQ